MWGGIYTEASYQLNFNTAFSTTRSDVLVHLSQWQYWWWFWFAFIWTFYYLVIAKVVRHRTLKMRPRIATSFRPHGKWGDFIAAIIPTVWCINIICNSNFILRLIEWQTESSLLTIRVRARQWYWIYKFDSKAIIDIFTAPKNIGRNKWLFSTLEDTKTSDSYMDLLELRAQNEWLKDYWNSYLNLEFDDKKELIAQPVDTNIFIEDRLVEPNLNINNEFSSDNYLSFFDDFTNMFFDKNFCEGAANLYSYTKYWKLTDTAELFDNVAAVEINPLNFTSVAINTESLQNNNSDLVELAVEPTELFMENSDLWLSNVILNGQYNDDADYLSDNMLSLFNSLHSIKNFTLDFIENSRFLKRTQGLVLPLRINKALFLVDSENVPFYSQWGNGDSTLKHKIKPYTTYLTFKQKRYKRKKIINFTTKHSYIDDSKINIKWKPVLVNNKFFANSEIDPTVSYKMIKKLKKKDEMIPLTLAKRLLRVKRTLIVPAHINLTVITSSYDIIHSWFIPGLGLKLDCVPGRSTHHTFYIDNVGFYFGQCAEICGRYHHHMPIRVCALPFDHFLTWWYHFGAPKLMITNNALNYNFRKYSW